MLMGNDVGKSFGTIYCHTIDIHWYLLRKKSKENNPYMSHIQDFINRIEISFNELILWTSSIWQEIEEVSYSGLGETTWIVLLIIWMYLMCQGLARSRETLPCPPQETLLAGTPEWWGTWEVTCSLYNHCQSPPSHYTLPPQTLHSLSDRQRDL